MDPPFSSKALREGGEKLGDPCSCKIVYKETVRLKIWGLGLWVRIFFQKGLCNEMGMKSEVGVCKINTLVIRVNLLVVGNERRTEQGNGNYYLHW